MINKVHFGDCLELMNNIPDGSVDMILCDLPYGTTQNKWDSIIDLPALWQQYSRIIKNNGAIVLTAQPPFDKVLGISNIELLRYEWVWIKEKGTGFMNINKMPLKTTENVLVFYKQLPTFNPQLVLLVKPYKHTLPKSKSKNYGQSGLKSIDSEKRIYKTYTHKSPDNVLTIARDNGNKGLHPTQKPVALFEYLIKTYTNEGEMVLDNCAGSGTTAIACINTSRNYILIEKEEKYYNIILDRIKKHTSQLTIGFAV